MAGNEEFEQIRFDLLGNTSEEKKSEIEMLPRHEILLADEKISPRYLKNRRRPWYEAVDPKKEYDEFVVLDTETTGVLPFRDEIVEIGAILYQKGRPVEAFETFIRPKGSIPPGATAVNGITDGMVQDAPRVHEVLPDFDDFVGGRLLVGHNLDFDLSFLYRHGSRIEDRRREYICTLFEARKLLVKKGSGTNHFDVLDHRLETLCDYFGIIIPRAHRAVMDAYGTAEVFLKLQELRKEMP
ncbi:MAG: 3'-5' exonuclease [Tissierellia bacterium]|nr:3'-5' exonuclease [Tissierellia bacterium]